MAEKQYRLIAKRKLTIESDTTDKKVPVKTKKVIVIDPGHGGRDAGSIYPINSKKPDVMEKEVAREIAKKLNEILTTSDSYIVYATRPLEADRHVPDWDGDGLTGYEGPWNKIPPAVVEAKKVKKKFEQKESLEDRAALANSKGADFFISIHTNSSATNPGACGMSAIMDTEMAGKARTETEKYREMLKGKLIAKCYNIAGFVSKDQVLLVIRRQQNKRPAILFEAGFLSNEKDRKILTSPEQQNIIALCIKEAMDEYFAKQGGN
ncbi:MAG: N-acetylmuramoyl-L-alanine amidase [Candidatus Vecturithrix sp.]|jgi:N-acetylmuramoyl-L-alanine amidase|nr:N-acetylmuramoyl-L-alanine amidase [Candidatus Vecturithrix sp.]